MKLADGTEVVGRWAKEYADCGEKTCAICQLIEQLSRAEAQNAEAKRGWDSCITDLREAAEICRRAEAQNGRLREALNDVVDGNDLACSRNQSMQSWMDSAFRKKARAALAETQPTATKEEEQ